MGQNGFEARAIGIAARRRGTVSKATSVDAKFWPVCVSDACVDVVDDDDEEADGFLSLFDAL